MGKEGLDTFIQAKTEYFQSLDVDQVMGFFVHRDLSQALQYKKSNFILEDLIYDKYISNLFDSFDQLSDFWQRICGKVRNYVTVFNNVPEPTIETFVDELFFLDVNGFVNTQDDGPNGRLIVRPEAQEYTDAEKAGMPRLDKSTNIKIIGSNGDFYEIEYLKEDGTTAKGYVPKKYVGIMEGCEAKEDGTVGIVGAPTQGTTPASTATGAEATPETETKTGYVYTEDAGSSGRLMLRPGAGYSGDTKDLPRLDKNAEVTIIGEDGDWLQIKDSEGHSGWVPSKYITDTPKSLNVTPQAEVTEPASQTATAEPQPEPTPSGSTTQTTYPAGTTGSERTKPDATDIASAQAASAASGSGTPASTNNSTVYVNTEKTNLNFRTSPNGEIKGTIGQGTKLTKIGEASDGFIKVKTEDGQVGYVSETYTSAVKPNTQYTSNANASTMRVGNFKDSGSHLNFRTLPTTEKNSQIIGGLTEGTVVKVIDSGRTDNWVEVEVNGKTGFVSKDYLVGNDK